MNLRVKFYLLYFPTLYVTFTQPLPGSSGHCLETFRSRKIVCFPVTNVIYLKSLSTFLYFSISPLHAAIELRFLCPKEIYKNSTSTFSVIPNCQRRNTLRNMRVNR
jgi:hypothetical protein